jgi:hypothetical protein
LPLTLPDVIVGVGVPWVLSVGKVYDVPGVPTAGFELTAVDVPGVLAVARGSLLLSPSLLLLTSLLFLVFPLF